MNKPVGQTLISRESMQKSTRHLYLIDPVGYRTGLTLRISIQSRKWVPNAGYNKYSSSSIVMSQLTQTVNQLRSPFLTN